MHYSKLVDMVLDVSLDVDTRNIETIIYEQAARFSEYVNLLDTSAIDFEQKDIFSRRKIAEYWDKFRHLAAGLNEVIMIFEEYKASLGAALTTLRCARKRAASVMHVINVHRKKSPAAASEAVQSMMTVSQAMCEIDSWLAKCSRMLSLVDNICSTGTAAFQQAILFAEVQMDFTSFDTSSYVKNYEAVKAALQS